MLALFGAFLAFFVTIPAFANPINTSVWIDVYRGGETTFRGHVLPKEGEGMGVVVGGNYIFTAAHVVWEAKQISVTTPAGAHVVAVIVAIDADTDSAVLRVLHTLTHSATIRQKPAVTGESVSVVTPVSASERAEIYSGKTGSTKWTSHGVSVPLIFSGIKGEKGMSGGGLYDAQDALIGIIVRIDGTLGYLHALPITEFCKRFSQCNLK